ncbi:MAG: L,D-transpeptidase [Myxococcota bacterium]
MSVRTTLGAVAFVVGMSACAEPAAPPGPTVTSIDPPLALSVPPPVTSGTAAGADGAAARDETVPRPGAGHRLASIAMRTWVYQEPHDEAVKLGYLRAGAVVARAEVPAGRDGCEGGWFRIAPRGFVCVGKGATLDLDHPVVASAPQGPRRGAPMPYRYVISREPPPHRYFKLPTVEEQRRAEGAKRTRSVALYGPMARDALGAPDPVPSALAAGAALPKPYGAERPLAYAVHRGRANPNSAFGLLATFDWTERPMGLTTELDMIPLDRTEVVRLSALRGRVVAAEERGTPAVVVSHGVKTYARNDRGKLTAVGRAPHRSGWVLTGETQGGAQGFVETTSGEWLPRPTLRVASVRDDPAQFAETGRKWIDVSIEDQLLVAYVGRRPVFATLVSTGRGGMGDPAETNATVRGTFMIHAKHVSGTMDGDDTTEDAFDLRDVPYIQYFHQGYALHGAYWHDDFGKERSHGCINLSPADAAWLFEWTEPVVPDGWHAALNLNAGTLVSIHR